MRAWGGGGSGEGCDGFKSSMRGAYLGFGPTADRANAYPIVVLT